MRFAFQVSMTVFFFCSSFSPKNFRIQGLVSNETVVFRRWGRVKRKSGMLNELIRVKLPP